MTVEDAILLIRSREGKPREDDWDLIEAAETLVNHLTEFNTDENSRNSES